MSRFAPISRSRLSRRALLGGAAAAGGAAALAARNGRAATPRLLATQAQTFENVELSVWIHNGTPAENVANEAIIEAFNAAYEGQIRAELQTISNSRRMSWPTSSPASSSRAPGTASSGRSGRSAAAKASSTTWTSSRPPG